MTDKTSKNMQQADHLLSEFRQRLPQRPPQDMYVQSDDVMSIKERMAKAKSEMPWAGLPAVDDQPDLPAVEDAPKAKAEPAPQAKKAAASVAKETPAENIKTPESIETNDGFQIFKSKSAPVKADPMDAPHKDDQTPQFKEVEPVPMAQDAIEDALKMIEDEDQLDAAEVHAEPAIGFTRSKLDPASFGVEQGLPEDITIGDFGAAAPAPEPAPEPVEESASHQPSQDDDLEQALSAELAQIDHAEDQQPDITTLDITGPNMTGPDMTGPDLSKLDAEQRQNMEIGHNMAQSIKSIIRDEVDDTLDRIARQAVRDALKAHHAT